MTAQQQTEKPSRAPIGVKDIVADFNRVKTPYALHYHGKTLPVKGIYYHRPGVILVTVKNGLPITFLEDGTYDGHANIWLERLERASHV